MLPSPVNFSRLGEFLLSNHWPPGLRDAVCSSVAKMPLRYVVIDDSGSMGAVDGNRLVKGDGICRLVVLTCCLVR